MVKYTRADIKFFAFAFFRHLRKEYGILAVEEALKANNIPFEKKEK